MSYHVEAHWTESATADYETFEDGIAKAKELALAHTEAAPTVRGSDLFAQLQAVAAREPE